MENAKLDEMSEGEMSVEDMEAFHFKLESWAEKFEIKDVIREKEDQLILAQAALDMKEKRNKELEMELEKTKLLLREIQMSGRRLEICGKNECLHKEIVELRRKIAEQEVTLKEDKKKIVTLTFDCMYANAKWKKQQEGADEKEAYEEMKRHKLQLENSAEEIRVLLKQQNFIITRLEDLLKRSQKKVTALKDQTAKPNTEGMQNLRREKESLINENQRLQEEVQRTYKAMETMKKEETSKLQRLADGSCKEALGLEFKPKPGETEMEKEVSFLRKRVKKAETVTMNDDSASSDSSGQEFKANKNRLMDIGIQSLHWSEIKKKQRQTLLKSLCKTDSDAWE